MRRSCWGRRASDAPTGPAGQEGRSRPCPGSLRRAPVPRANRGDEVHRRRPRSLERPPPWPRLPAPARSGLRPAPERGARRARPRSRLPASARAVSQPGGRRAGDRPRARSGTRGRSSRQTRQGGVAGPAAPPVAAEAVTSAGGRVERERRGLATRGPTEARARRQGTRPYPGGRQVGPGRGWGGCLRPGTAIDLEADPAEPGRSATSTAAGRHGAMARRHTVNCRERGRL